MWQAKRTEEYTLGYPRASPVSRIAFLNRPSTSEFYAVRGLQLHLRRWAGPQQPLRLILHGWSDTSATWQRVVEHLPADWNIVAPDWRGFGLSQRQGDTYVFADYLGDLDGLLRELDAGPIDLIGHSMGGQIAALYAGLRPERVRKLVILDSLFLPDPKPSEAPARLRRWLDDLPDPGTEKLYPDLETLAQRVRRYHPGLDEAGALDVAAAWSEATPEGYRLLADPRHRQRGPLLYRDAEALAVFAGIEAPSLILDAADSGLRQQCPESLREPRIAAIPKAQRAEIPNCGHMMHFDAPAPTAAAIADFLSTAD